MHYSLQYFNENGTVGTDEATDTLIALTDTDNYGGAVAWHTRPCVVIYSVPVWIMPNGMCRVGDPNAPMIDRDHAIRVIRNRPRP